MSRTSNSVKMSFIKWDWQLQGACRNYDSEIFFHPEGERGSTRRRRDEKAKQICQACPVLQECRDYALRQEEPYGVWGGLSQEERSEIVSKRRRAARCVA